MTPSTTIGVASTPRAVRALMSCDHARPSWPTLAVVIRVSGLKRCSEYVRPCASQLCGSVSAAWILTPVTFGVTDVPAHPTASHTTSEATLIRLIVPSPFIGAPRPAGPQPRDGLRLRTAFGESPGRAAPSLARGAKEGQDRRAVIPV